MPRKKRSRKHKRHRNDRNHFSGADSKIVEEDNVLRTCLNAETSLNITPTVAANVKTADNNETPSPDFFFEVPKVLLINNSNKILRSHSSSDVITPNTPIRKRRNISRESGLGYSGLPYLFNLSGTPENVMSDLKERHSSTILDQKQFSKHRVRSHSSLAKLHSPGIEKVPLKADISTQTIESKDVGCITETPQFNHDSLLDFDYKIKVLQNKSLSGYVTPLKRMRIDSITPFSNVKDTAERIQDLNNLQNQQTRYKTFNCSKVLNGESLRKLQNFNEIILNTSQSINYDNCELEEVEDNAEQGGKHETSTDDLSGIENSFFTPQLYNGKLASTPITQAVDKAVGDEEAVPNKAEIVRCQSIKEVQSSKKILKSVTSTSTQVEKFNFSNHVGIQTVQVNEKGIIPVAKTRVSKERQCVVSVNKRRTYKSLPSAALYYKISPRRDIRLGPIHRISLERTDSAETVAAIETFARIFAKVKKYHGRYSSKLPAKIIEICTWLGITIKKGITSLYQLYTEQNKKIIDCPSDTNCNKCNSYLSQLSKLTSTVEELNTEIINMKQDNQDKSEKLALLHSEINQLRQELAQFEDLRKELQELKGQLNTKSAVPPPPPPPPPPLLPALSIPHNNSKTVKVAARKKSNENARPIISLEDILKVKLKKISDRRSPMRRATEPLVSNALKQVRLRPTTSKPQTPSNGSPSSASSVSNSPRSSLTRILTNVDTNEKST
ncbi:hypothetical protein ILUMI_06382 [Ignelater luminosus]|uniref:Uncharacterized protein n=1 Tax=Ignelater luminosus TaxID=2038154 RepID=A0A8K0GHA0_IGNLU|nr:hypothetical protein ILUMI_06382 [Ignelater luminosus]